MRTTLIGAAAALGLGLCLPSQSNPEAAFRGFPLFFERNGGRFADDVAFVARRRGYQLFLTADGSSLALRSSERGDRFAAAVHTRFVGANRAPEIVGEERLPTRIHYLIGRDPGGFSTDNATFGRVRYGELWPGIDLLLYDRGGELEYDFVVAPGANPTAIRLA